MTSEELEKLEQEAGTQELIRAARSLRDKENATLSPPSFDRLSLQLAGLEGKKKNPFSRLHFSVRSPWWMTAACLIGILIGWQIPRPGGEMAALHTLYDTIRITDTLLRQIEIPKAPSQKERSFRTASPPKVATATRKRKQPPYSDSIESAAKNETIAHSNASGKHLATSDIPVSLDHILQEERGRSVADENFPFHLINQSSSYPTAVK